jgi:hypothetical protein
MQMVDQMFYRRVKKLGHDHNRTRERGHGPPDCLGSKYAKRDEDTGARGHLESQTMLGTNPISQPRQCKAQAPEKRLIFGCAHIDPYYRLPSSRGSTNTLRDTIA